MRWDALRLDEPTEPTGPAERGAAAGAAPASPVALPLLSRGAVTRRFDTPEFAGMTFHEVHARSALNAVPKASRMPFRWTVNPYRGCSHACRYCFARGTHTYLDLDAGADFDSQVVVKVNVAEVLRRELAAPAWRREHVALGTNTDPYQRVEGRYRLMPGIVSALHASGTPFSILTKSALLLRDLDLLRAAARDVDVSAALSVGSVDDEAWRTVEPGTPRPGRRLEAVARLNEAGIPTGVLMAPVLPFLTDSDEQLDATVAAIAAAGATYVTPIALHLRPGAREWYLGWLGATHPQLVDRYRHLYGGGAYAPASYTRPLAERVHALAQRYGLGSVADAGRHRTWRTGHERAGQPAAPAPAGTLPEQQLSLL